MILIKQSLLNILIMIKINYPRGKDKEVNIGWARSDGGRPMGQSSLAEVLIRY